MNAIPDSTYCYTFPAVRGIQAGKPFYIATCPLRIIPKIFMYDEDEVPPDLRAQRTLNKSRIPEMVRYLLDNPDNYVFSALTASIETNIQFDEASDGSNLGSLKVPMDAKILINDGQHRRKAIEEAIKERPELGHDNIPVLFFVDEGLSRSQQMFADLNKYAVKPSPSLSTLYDHRDPSSYLARFLATEVLPFKGFTELEKSNISLMSNKLFTLSGIKQATRALLGKGPRDGFTNEDKDLAIEFWSEVYANMPEWKQVIDKEVSPTQLRQEFIHAHGVGIHAIGLLGKDLVCESPKNWKEKLSKLREVDWRKSNPEWNQRCMHGGKLSKATQSIQLTNNLLKQAVGLKLTPFERQLENQIQ